jgi:hypothetical protein
LRIGRAARALLFDFTCRCAAVLFRVVPRRRRFGAALLMCRAVEPLARRAGWNLMPRIPKLDGTAEILLFLVLRRLTRHGTGFDPDVHVDDYAAVREAFTAGKGVLVLAPHTMLLHLLFRRFYDDGFAPVGLSRNANDGLFGTTERAAMLAPSPQFLVRVRTHLRRGRLVCAMPDRQLFRPGRMLEFDTATGSIFVAPALMQLAVRVGARVLFTEVHVAEGRVCASIASPSSRTAEGLLDEFVGFVRAHVARHLR